MKRAVTISMLVVLACTALPAAAQDRSDQVLWARDIGAESITLDGNLDEAMWSQADMLTLVWGESAGLPGSGWRFHETGGVTPVVADPTDPTNATIYALRKGNILYLGFDVPDKSIGGSTGLWAVDGIVASIINKAKYDTVSVRGDDGLFFNSSGSEFIYSWWHEADTSATGDPLVGKLPRFHNGDGLGSANNVASLDRTDEQKAVWDAAINIDGTSNDDAHGDDVGYVVEMMLDVSWLGFDGDQAGGDGVPISLTVVDTDWRWPLDLAQSYTTRTFWQNQWGNNLNEGYGLIMMSPDVTLTSGELPNVAPDFTIANGELFDHPVVDGSLDDDTWVRVDPLVFLQYQGAVNNARNPTWTGTGVNYYRPGSPDPIVVDPSLAEVKFFYKDTKLYIGAHVSDQAISGALGEGGDGMSFTINQIDSTTSQQTQWHRRFIVNIDSTGSAVVSGDIDTTWTTDQFVAAVKPIGASTPADPTDVDSGYEIEIMIDVVDVLGYPADLGDGFVYVGAHLFDADNFEDPLNDYSMRTWWLRERTEGPGAVGYMDPTVVIGTGVDGESPDVASALTILGNYPNPFSQSTTLRYLMPTAGEVSVVVYDILGRQIVRLEKGMQSAGENDVTFSADNVLASGVYSYRIEVKDQFTDDIRSTAVGQMMIVK